MVCQNTLLDCQYWNLVYVRNSPKISFWTFSPLGLRTFALQRTVYAKKIGFVPNPDLVDDLLCSNSTFHLVPQ